MTKKQSEENDWLFKILTQLDQGGYLGAGGVPAARATVLAKIGELLDEVDERVVVAAEIPYRKLEECPSCGASYMYQCSCDVAGDYIAAKLRQQLVRMREEWL